MAVAALTRNLFSVTVLTGIYSFLMATVLVALNAVDVAMTEAAVGAGVSTVLLLGALRLCRSEEAKPVHKPWLPLAASVSAGALLVYGGLGLPGFGDREAPIHHHVVPRYLQNETQIPNVVTSILASFRGYDTLGETTVVFTAGAGIIALLRRRKKNAGSRRKPMKDDLVLRVVGRLLTPFILLFALYVQFHGDFGPGGGFQAGVIFATGIVLYALINGVRTVRRVVPGTVAEAMVAGGVLVYAGVGLAGLLFGGEYLDYSVLGSDPVHGQHLGIFLVETGVAVTVCGVMLKIFYMFARRGRGSGMSGHFAYIVTIALMIIGLFIIIARSNLIKKLVGLSIFQTSVYLLYIAPGKILGGTAPILNKQYSIYSNPLPHVLILTAIVVGVATLALGLALAVRLREAYGTVEEDEILERDRAAIASEASATEDA